MKNKKNKTLIVSYSFLQIVKNDIQHLCHTARTCLSVLPMFLYDINIWVDSFKVHNHAICAIIKTTTKSTETTI